MADARDRYAAPSTAIVDRMFRTAYPNAIPIAITFEGGTDSGNVPKVLDALKSAGVRATFFVNGLNANNMHYDGARGIVKRIYSEANNWPQSSLHANPHNEQGPKVIKQLVGMGYVVVSHNVDSGDSDIDGAGNPGTQAVIEFDKSISHHSGASPKTHSFITLHNEWVENSHSGIQAIVQKYRKLGYTFVTVGECLGQPNPKSWYRVRDFKNWLEFDAFCLLVSIPFLSTTTIINLKVLCMWTDSIK
ncbi:hypothetical protein BSLG_005625 [Batrachochytrium salamandrivorans]|nr:hypothetical protein BSLG_005625 [Batrachochytrium salamandrivorans]